MEIRTTASMISWNSVNGLPSRWMLTTYLDMPSTRIIRLAKREQVACDPLRRWRMRHSEAGLHAWAVEHRKPPTSPRKTPSPTVVRHAKGKRAMEDQSLVREFMSRCNAAPAPYRTLMNPRKAFTGLMLVGRAAGKMLFWVLFGFRTGLFEYGNRPKPRIRRTLHQVAAVGVEPTTRGL